MNEAKATRNLSDVCAALAAALVAENSNEHQKHFVDAARSFMAGMVMAEILEVKAQGEVPALSNMRVLLADGGAMMAKGDMP